VRAAPEIALRPLPGSEDEQPRSELLVEGRPTGSVIAGCVLEAAVRCEPGWLVFATNDIPYEEFLNIHLLDESAKPLDSARIGGPNSTGMFSRLRLEPPATVHFRFIDEADWSVRVLSRPKRTLPWRPDARGVWRGAGLTRHFEVRRTPA
jgi:hypothetical protein